MNCKTCGKKTEPNKYGKCPIAKEAGWLHELSYSKRKSIDTIKEENGMCDQCYEDYLDDKELKDYCADCDPDCFWNCETELEPDLTAGVFFTAQACQAHIDANHYHYNKPVVYGIGSWRNPEMQLVQKHILEVAGEKIPSHYA